MSLQQGDIIWATVAGQSDGFRKRRPLLVVTPTDEIDPDSPIVAVAVTSTFTLPLPENQIELPWRNGGHPGTKLSRKCVAVCDWLVVIEHADIVATGGKIYGSLLQQILDQLPE